MRTATSSTCSGFHNPKLKVMCVKFIVCLFVCFKYLLQSKQEHIQESHVARAIEGLGVDDTMFSPCLVVYVLVRWKRATTVQISIFRSC